MINDEKVQAEVNLVETSRGMIRRRKDADWGKKVCVETNSN